MGTQEIVMVNPQWLISEVVKAINQSNGNVIQKTETAPSTERAYMTVKEVEQYHNISRASINRMIQKGKLKPIEREGLNQRLIFERAEVMKLKC